MRYLLLILSLSACAPTHKNVVSIDSKIAPYVQRFLDEGASHGLDVPVADLIVQFGSSGDAGGTCVVGPSLTPTVTIGIDWSTATDSYREELVFHELGHCLLGRVHSYAMYTSTQVNSIMYPSLPEKNFYNEPAAHEHYMIELFSGQ